MKNFLKASATIIMLVLVIVGAGYTLFYDSTDIFYHKVESNKEKLTVGEYLEKDNLLSSVKITPELRQKLGEVRMFVEKSEKEPPCEKGDVMISIGGSKIENILFIRFTNSKP
ncbi:MAG TPA: hypothetical protein PLB52_00175 [Candidatus Moranbacteria bacterium]|nr:hypothetical protein [Candidatus Moranbacteria bacterium]